MASYGHDDLYCCKDLVILVGTDAHTIEGIDLSTRQTHVPQVEGTLFRFRIHRRVLEQSEILVLPPSGQIVDGADDEPPLRLHGCPAAGCCASCSCCASDHPLATFALGTDEWMPQDDVGPPCRAADCARAPRPARGG